MWLATNSTNITSAVAMPLATMSPPLSHLPSTAAGDGLETVVDSQTVVDAPFSAGFSLNVDRGEGRRSGMALWFASAFGDVRGVVGALNAGVRVGSLSPLDPYAWWLASAPRPHTACTAHGASGSSTRVKPSPCASSTTAQMSMRLMSSLHLALRWLHLDAGHLSPSLHIASPKAHRVCVYMCVKLVLSSRVCFFCACTYGCRSGLQCRVRTVERDNDAKTQKKTARELVRVGAAAHPTFIAQEYTSQSCNAPSTGGLAATGTALHSLLMHAAPQRLPWSQPPSASSTEWVRQEGQEHLGRWWGAGWKRQSPKPQMPPLFSLFKDSGQGHAATPATHLASPATTLAPLSLPPASASTHRPDRGQPEKVGGWDRDLMRDSERREMAQLLAAAMWPAPRHDASAPLNTPAALGTRL